MVDITKPMLAKKEAVYGTDIVPIAADNAMLTRNFRPTPVQTDTLERNLDLPSLGRSKSANTNARTAMSFEVELAGSSDADLPPAWMELLEGCGMAAPEITALTDVKQRFVAAGAPKSSLSIYHWRGDMRRRTLGVRGSFGMNFSAGAYPFATLNMLGLLPTGPFTTVALPAPDYSKWKEPLEVNTENTDYTLDGFALKLRSFAFDIGAQTSVANLVGERSVTRSNHAITGTVVGRCPGLAEKDYFLSLRSGQQVAQQLIHGVAAGSIIQLDLGFTQILGIEEQEDGDTLDVSISFGANISVGRDDLIITTK